MYRHITHLAEHGETHLRNQIKYYSTESESSERPCSVLSFQAKETIITEHVSLY